MNAVLFDRTAEGVIPTTIGGLLSAIGIAGMDRMIRANVVATSGRAVEAAGDVDVLLLDKTGTITLGDRQAVAFHAAPGVSERDLGDVAQLASLADETPEGRSVVVLAKQKFQLRGRDLADSAYVIVFFLCLGSGVVLAWLLLVRPDHRALIFCFASGVGRGEGTT